MGIVQFPVGRLAGHAERIAFRQGQARPNAGRPPLRIVAGGTPSLCASCAPPIEDGAGGRGGGGLCSGESSPGGKRPASVASAGPTPPPPHSLWFPCGR